MEHTEHMAWDEQLAYWGAMNDIAEIQKKYWTVKLESAEIEYDRRKKGISK